MALNQPARPLADRTVDDLRAIVDEVRRELAHRRSSAARHLREEVEPGYSIDRARDCSVYVIELDDAVRGVRRFRQQNPDARADRPCLYVGSTSLTPEARFAQHRAGGKKASAGPRDFGVRLRPEFYARYPPMTRNEALAEEAALAELLRREGYGVWQG